MDSLGLPRATAVLVSETNESMEEFALPEGARGSKASPLSEFERSENERSGLAGEEPLRI